MKKNNNKKHQKQTAKQIPKNHGNFQKFVNSKPSTNWKIKTLDTEEVETVNQNVSKFKDCRLQPNQFANFIDNSYKSTKKIKLFELDSDEEKKNALTHHGKDINELKNDFQISDSESENQYADKMQQKMMKQTNFGGFEEKDEEHQKSKAEIYKEIIKKSKLMKYERQKLREENETMRLQLDQGYSDLVPLLTFKKNGQQKKQLKKGDDVDDYMQLKKSLEQEVVIVRPLKQVKKEEKAEEIEENDNESAGDYESEKEQEQD